MAAMAQILPGWPRELKRRSEERSQEADGESKITRGAEGGEGLFPESHHSIIREIKGYARREVKTDIKKPGAIPGFYG
jgi:hypothetical protein